MQCKRALMIKNDNYTVQDCIIVRRHRVSGGGRPMDTQGKRFSAFLNSGVGYPT